MFSSSKPKFDHNKAKVQLKMLINRLNLLSSKKGNLAKAEKRKVAMLLREDKEHNARILVEQIIREDYTLEAYDLIKQFTEQLLARFNVVITEQDLKPEIADSVCALVYSGWLMGTEIDELRALFNLFTAKYGKVYTQEVLDHKEKYINARLLRILSSTQVPDPTVVDAYLTEIAKTYGVEYIPKPRDAIQPLSATLGIALPSPGMPMPVPPEPVDISEAPAAAPGGEAVPLATPIVMPAPASGGGGSSNSSGPQVVPQPYTAMLSKRSDTGFGLLLSPDNVVTGLKEPSDAASLEIPNGIGKILPGDRVLAINGQPCSPELPAKSLSADIDMGVTAAFTMLRTPVLTSDPIDIGGASQQPAAAIPVVQVPVSFDMPTIINPADGPAAPVGLPPVAPGVQLPPVAQPVQPTLPPVAPPPPAPTIYPPALPAADDADDLLARRLEALKRG